MPIENILAIVGFLILMPAMVAFFVWRERRAKGAHRYEPPSPEVQEKIRRYHAEKSAERHANEPRAQRRLVVNPTTSFERLSASLESCGFVATAPASSKEPTTFSWATDPAKAKLSYTYDPDCDLRILDLDAPASILKGYVDDIVNEPGWISTCTTLQLAKFLEASEPRSILLGLRAAAQLGKGESYREFYEPVAKLRTHADGRIADEAKRVEALLLAESGGKPKPPGLRGEAIAWRETTDAEFPYETERNGMRLRIRIGDFPAESMYTLVGELEGRSADMASFDDWPADWTRPEKKAPAAAAKAAFVVPAEPDGVGLTYDSGMEHSPTCMFGKTTLVLEGNGTLRLEMRRAGRKSAWEGTLTMPARVKLLEALRTAAFPDVPKKNGPPGAIVPGTTFDTLTVTLAAGAAGAKASITMEANELRFDKRYAPVWTMLHCLMRQVSAGKVGYVDDTLGPAVEASKQVA